MTPVRKLTFTYEVPEGADINDLDSKMEDALTTILGCTCHRDYIGPCQGGSWVMTTEEAPWEPHLELVE